MRLVIIGFGYSAAVFARAIRDGVESLHVTTRSAEKCARLAAEGWNAIPFDGSTCPPALDAAIRTATHLLISAPPGNTGDPAIMACEAAITAASKLERVLYLSTIGVYGDHGGDWVNEDSAPRPGSERNRNRVVAERDWQRIAEAKGFDLGIFRLAGIYGPGRNAMENVRAGKARRIIKPGQVFNRIHVGDIAGVLAKACRHPGPLGTFNLADDEPAPPQDVIAYAAELAGLPVPPDTPFETAEMTEMARSFYSDNKRVSNARVKAVLGYSFRYPTYREGLRACLAG